MGTNRPDIYINPSGNTQVGGLHTNMRLITIILSTIISLGLTAQTTFPAHIEAESYYYYKGTIGGTATNKYLTTKTGDWVGYSITAPSAGSYLIKLFTASDTLSIAQLRNGSGAVLSTFYVPANGWSPLQTTVILPAGKQTLWLLVNRGHFSLDYLEMVPQYVSWEQYSDLKTRLDSLDARIQRNVVRFDGRIFDTTTIDNLRIVTIPRLIKTP